MNTGTDEKKKGKYSIYPMRAFMYFFGIISTMPLLQVFGITLQLCCSLLFVVFIGIDMIIRGNIKLNSKKDKVFFLFFISTFISLKVNLFTMSDIWKNGEIVSYIQFSILVVYYFYYLKTNRTEEVRGFVKGIYASCIIQMIWGYMQYILYYFNIDLNGVIFNGILGMTDMETTQNYGETIKVSGLCWNSGNIAPILVIGFTLSKNIVLKALFFLLALFSNSRTAVLGVIVCLCVQLFYEAFLRKKIKQLLLILAAFFAVLFLLLTNSAVLSLISVKTQAAFGAILNTQRDVSANVHLRYLNSVFDIIRKNSLIHNLFGFGIDCSGFVFAEYYNQYSGLKWVVECDYINVLWNYGIVGFLLYYIWYIKNVIRSTKVNFKYFILFAGLMIEGFFYNVTFNWNLMFIMSLFILVNKNIDIFGEKD